MITICNSNPCNNFYSFPPIKKIIVIFYRISHRSTRNLFEIDFKADFCLDFLLLFFRFMGKSMECAASGIEAQKKTGAYDACFCRNESEKIGHLAVGAYVFIFFIIQKQTKVSVYTLSKEETDTFAYSMIFLTSTFTPAVGLEPTTS